jgi:hypothetical protein
MFLKKLGQFFLMYTIMGSTSVKKSIQNSLYFRLSKNNKPIDQI